jgi:uncharacterized membrane protein
MAPLAATVPTALQILVVVAVAAVNLVEMGCWRFRRIVIIRYANTYA